MAPRPSLDRYGIASYGRRNQTVTDREECHVVEWRMTKRGKSISVGNLITLVYNRL